MTGTVSGNSFAAVLVQQGLSSPYTGGAIFTLEVTNLTAPIFLNPTTTGFANVPTTPESMRLYGSDIYVVTNTGTYYIINFSNPSAGITIAGSSTAVSGQVWSSDIAAFSGGGTRAYLAGTGTTHSLYILDVTTPSAITLVNNSSKTFTATGIVVLGNYVFVGDYDDQALAVFNISAVSTTSSPVFIISLSLGIHPNMITAHPNGTTLYITQYNGPTLCVVDTTIPTAPVLSSSLTLPVSGVASPIRAIVPAAGTTMYIGGGNGLIAVYNVTTPLSPTFTTTYNTGFGQISSTMQIDVDSSSNIYLPVRSTSVPSDDAALILPNQLQIYTPIDPLYITPTVVSPAYYNMTGQLIGGCNSYAASSVVVSISGTTVTSSVLTFTGLTPSTTIAITTTGTTITSSSPNSFFPVKGAWVLPRQITLTNLWVTINVIANTLAGGNLRLGIFVSTDNGNSYTINPNLYVDFTPTQMIVGSIQTNLSPVNVIFQPGTMIAVIPTFTLISTLSGSVTVDIAASLSYA